MSLDLCLKQLHVRLLLFYSVIFQSCKFQSPLNILCFSIQLACELQRKRVTRKNVNKSNNNQFQINSALLQAPEKDEKYICNIY